MSIADKVQNQISDFLKSKTDELTAQVLSSVPDPELQAEAERLRRPEKLKPSPEAAEQASRLHAHANTLKSEVASIIEKDILPKIDSIVAAHNQAAALELTIPNFMLANYLNDLKGIFNKYQNAVVMGRRPLPAAADNE